MQLKKLTHKLLLVAGSACFALMVFACPSATLSAQAASSDAAVEASVQPRADDIRYVYKIVDGKMYKCLYNYSTLEWIGDWVYVCDYPQ